MKAKLTLGIFILSFVFIEVAAQPSESCYEPNDVYRYECGNKFYRYDLNDDLQFYGVVAGQYESGKEAYVGISVYLDRIFQGVRLQLEPPGGFPYNAAGPATFSNDSSRLWYLYNNKDHRYAWIDANASSAPSHAVDIREEGTIWPQYIARVFLPNGFVSIGSLAPVAGLMFYVDEGNVSRTRVDNFQILTCLSRIQNETKFLMPKLNPPKEAADGCVHQWLPFYNDDAPSKNGLLVDENDCNVTSYVGKADVMKMTVPGRIQSGKNSGFYAQAAGKSVFVANGSFYLYDNPRYSYRWVDYDIEKTPENAVLVKIGSSFGYQVSRVRVNDRMHVGQAAFPTAFFPDGGRDVLIVDNFEILVCDPRPRYQCAQEWRKFSDSHAVANDGLNVENTTAFIGRTCAHELGRLEVTPPAGLNYLDESKARGALATAEIEYLVRNSSNFYKWQPSRNGRQVANALAQFREGKRPFYIGFARVNGVVHVGKVRPGQGLFIADENGRQISLSSYSVLTCTSPDASRGLYEEVGDAEWNAEHWCPPRKHWSYEAERCACREEFRGILAVNGTKWSEELCAYVDG